MHPIAERILAGEIVCPSEIKTYNAELLLRGAERIESGDLQHDPKQCRNKDCIDHGDPTKTNREFAYVLLEEVSEPCPCHSK